MNWNMWKQPIPTDLDRIFGNDYQLQLLFRELLYRACNADTMSWQFQGKHVTLKRGQVLFGRHQFSKYLDIHPSKIERIFQRFVKFSDNHPDIQADIQRSSNYTIVTIKNYDEIISMNNQPDNQPDSKRTSIGQAVGQASDTSKSNKSVEKENEDRNFFPTHGYSYREIGCEGDYSFYRNGLEYEACVRRDGTVFMTEDVWWGSDDSDKFRYAMVTDYANYPASRIRQLLRENGQEEVAADDPRLF